jgi:hypothetical protein
MTISHSLIIAVEDELSGAVMSKLVACSGRNFTINRVFNARGNVRLREGMAKFRAASRVLPHIVLTDLDRCPCPLELINNWSARQLPPQLLFRIAVREVEAWLMADRAGIAQFLHIDISKVPQAPETEEDPKRTLINLARKSRKRRLAQEIVPETGSTAKIGVLYNAHFVNFVNYFWDIEQARLCAPSLDRTLSRISTFLSE